MTRAERTQAGRLSPSILACVLLAFAGVAAVVLAWAFFASTALHVVGVLVLSISAVWAFRGAARLIAPAVVVVAGVLTPWPIAAAAYSPPGSLVEPAESSATPGIFPLPDAEVGRDTRTSISALGTDGLSEWTWSPE